MQDNQNQGNNRRGKRKSLACEGIFLVINQIINIILTLINIGFGNIYCIIIEILNAFSGIIFYFKRYRETTLLVSNIVYLVVTCIIFSCYNHDKIFP